LTLRQPVADDPRAEREATPTASPDGTHASQSTIRRVVGGAMVLLSTQPITWAATLLLTVYLPRYLDGRAMGELSLALSAAAIIGTIATFGLPTVLTRTVASSEKDAPSVVSASLVIVVGLSTLGAVFTIMLGLSGHALDIGTTLLILAMVWMVVAQVQALLMAVLAGQQRLGEFAWVNAGGLLISSVGSVGVLMLGGTAADTMVVTLIVALVATGVLWYRLKLPFDPSGVTRRGLLGLGKSGLPFVAWNVLLRVRGDVDSIVLAMLLSVEAVGWWSAAQRIISIPVFVPAMVITPLLPALSSVRENRDVFTRTLRRTFELTVVVTTGISAGIAAFAPMVPKTLGWAASYEAAVPVMQLMAPLLIFVSISMVLGTGLIGLGQERPWLAVNAVATGLQYVVLFIAIPAMQDAYGNGSIGAALGRFAAELVMVAGALIIMPRGMIGWASGFFLVRTLAVGLAAAVAALWVLDLSLILAGVTGVLAYGAGLLLLGVIRPADITALAQATLATVRRRSGAANAVPATPDITLERSDGSPVRP